MQLQQHSFQEANQRGVALVVSLVFLLIITIISVVAATNSKVGLTMTGNLQDAYESFQAAEAGVLAAIATHGTGDDVFVGADVKEDVFDDFADDEGPLGHLRDGSGRVTVDVMITHTGACERAEEDDVGESGFTVGEFPCQHFRIDGEHDVPRKALTRVSQGVIRTTIN